MKQSLSKVRIWQFIEEPSSVSLCNPPRFYVVLFPPTCNTVLNHIFGLRWGFRAPGYQMILVLTDVFSCTAATVSVLGANIFWGYTA